MGAKSTGEWQEPKPLTPDEVFERERGLKMIMGVLSRFFRTPIDYWENLTEDELQDWAEVMREISYQERRAMEEEIKRSR